jgi:hypothetical protein
MIKFLRLAGLHELWWIFSSYILDIASTACSNHHLHCSTSIVQGPLAGSYLICMLLSCCCIAACPIAARWNIVLQIESNRTRTVYHTLVAPAGRHSDRCVAAYGQAHCQLIGNGEHCVSESACALLYLLKTACMYCIDVGVKYIHIQYVHMCEHVHPQMHMSVCVCIVCMCLYEIVSDSSNISNTGIYIQIHTILTHTCIILIHTNTDIYILIHAHTVDTCI